jgi:5-methylcytosine-specific restriction endonuclease McrA
MIALTRRATRDELHHSAGRDQHYPERVRPASDYLQRNGARIESHRLKRKLLDEGIFDPECATCGGTTWQGVPIPLELEHKNGNRNDNRLENLELLSPNCHALTPTYRGRNIGGYNVESA